MNPYWLWLASFILAFLSGHITGRLYGKMLHHKFLAEGFKYLDRTVPGRGSPIHKPTTSAKQISAAFGSVRQEREKAMDKEAPDCDCGSDLTDAYGTIHYGDCSVIWYQIFR